MIDIGKAMLGISVAERFRRKRKITSTTSTTARNSVNFTSPTDWRIETERSYKMCIWTEGGMIARNCGNNVFTASTTSTVFVPGCRSTANTTELVLFHQFATRSFCTLSKTFH